MKLYEDNKSNIKINWNRFDDEVQTGVELCRIIEDEGYEAYIVGGCVRDIVYWHETGAKGNPEVHDVDITTNMPIDELYACDKFRCTSNNGEAHGTILVIYKGIPFEVTQFRMDGTYTDGRHPDSVQFTNSFEEDTKRRDFTINAMGIDCEGNVIDYHNGVEDLFNKVIRTVGDPKERFSEDALRIIRALRFAARFDMDIDDDTINAIVELAPTLKKVAKERIGAEILKTLDYGINPFKRLINYIYETDVYLAIDPTNLLKWESASKLVSKWQGSDLDDSKIILACLFSNIQIKDLKRAMDMFRFENSIYKMLNYMYTNEDVVNDPEADIIKTVKAINNPDFENLMGYVLVKYGTTMTPEEYNKYLKLAKTVNATTKDINKAIEDAGYTGANFGKMLQKVNAWYYDAVLKGKQPSNVEIAEFIDNTL